MSRLGSVIVAALLLGSSEPSIQRADPDFYRTVCVPLTTHSGPFESRTPPYERLIEALFADTRTPSLQKTLALLGSPALSRPYGEDRSELVWVDANLRIDISIGCGQPGGTGYENRTYVTRHRRFLFVFQSDSFVSCTFDTSTVFSPVPWDLPDFGSSPFDVTRDCRPEEN